jgi:hypothetical protein
LIPANAAAPGSSLGWRCCIPVTFSEIDLMIPEHLRPAGDPLWTPDQEAVFFAKLNADFPKGYPPEISERGAAGYRLRANLVADIGDVPLREFAATVLNAKRCSKQYLYALRIVLGNQADAEQHGYLLEMNLRVPFAPVQVMRTIINQMAAAKISFGKMVLLGRGWPQVVQCFRSAEPGPAEPDEAALLNAHHRKQEAKDHAAQVKARGLDKFPPTRHCLGLMRDEVPF